MKKHSTFIILYFSKSYLKPHTEHAITVSSAVINRVKRKLERKGYDTFREEYTGVEA